MKSLGEKIFHKNSAYGRGLDSDSDATVPTSGDLIVSNITKQCKSNDDVFLTKDEVPVIF